MSFALKLLLKKFLIKDLIFLNNLLVFLNSHFLTCYFSKIKKGQFRYYKTRYNYMCI